VNESTLEVKMIPILFSKNSIINEGSHSHNKDDLNDIINIIEKLEFLENQLIKDVSFEQKETSMTILLGLLKTEDPKRINDFDLTNEASCEIDFQQIKKILN